MFKDMKIGAKTVFGYVVSIVITVIIGAFAILNLNTVSQNTQIFYEQAFKQNDSVGKLATALAEVKMNLLKALLADNVPDSQKAVDEAIAASSAMRVQLDFLKKSYTEANDTAMLAELDAMEKAIAPAKATRETIQKYAVEGKKAEAFKMYIDVYEPGFTTVKADMVKLSDEASEHAEKFVSEANDLKKQTLLVMLLIMAAGLAIVIFMTISIVNGINRPIKEMVDVTKKMAHGDLHVDVHYSSKNEFGQMADGMRTIVKVMQTYIGNIAQSLGKMAEGDMASSIDLEYIGDFAQIKSSMDQIKSSLNEILSQINISSDQVANGADQVSSAAQALSQGTTEQASAIEQLSASIEDISTQVKKNAGSAQDAQSISVGTAKQIEDANEQMVEMVGAMANINETSKKISKIIKTIDDIAFQTNILALNAAVEAARAGEAGKGFAVVADEVRNLASKSAEAAKETTTLIESSIQAVDRGTKIADGTASSLEEIVEKAKRSAELVSSISEATAMQAQVIAQFTQGIAQISSVVQTNSATAEESAAASEELSGQSSLLTQLVGTFKLKNTDSDFKKPLKLELPSQTRRSESHDMKMSFSKY